MPGWAAVALAVAGYDGWALARKTETMSSCYRRAYSAHPLVVGVATVYLVGHLTGHLPRSVDLLRRSCP